MRRARALLNVWRRTHRMRPLRRCHQAVRGLMMPFERLLEELPEEGRLLDLGCGDGLFLALAAHARPNLQLLGIDLSEAKVASARAALAPLGSRVELLDCLRIEDFPEASVDVVSIIDVLYLLPLELWSPILARAKSCLRPGGKLLFKEIDRDHRLRFGLLRLQEQLAVNVLGWTEGEQAFTFPPRDQVTEMLSSLGFSVTERSLAAGFVTPHHLWVART